MLCITTAYNYVAAGVLNSYSQFIIMPALSVKLLKACFGDIQEVKPSKTWGIIVMQI